MLLGNYFIFCIHLEIQISHEHSQDKMGTKIGTRINKMVCNYCLLCISCPSDIQISYEQRHRIMSDSQKLFLFSAPMSTYFCIQISFSEVTPCFRTCQSVAFWEKQRERSTLSFLFIGKVSHSEQASNM